MSTTTISPTLTLPNRLDSGEQIEGYKLWVSIPANDDTGVIIDNVLPGDEIIIYDASGICSFDKTNMAMVKAIVGLANAVAGDVVMYATDGAAAPFVASWNEAVKKIGDAVGDSDIEHKRRDAYGRDPGTGDYGKHEGGLIVCMPKSKGAVYATDDYYLADGSKDNGRKESYYSSAAKAANLMYPCPVSGGLMRRTATEAGAIHVLAFDENFSDNAGAYNVGLMVIRSERPTGTSSDEIYNNLMGAAPSSSISG